MFHVIVHRRKILEFQVLDGCSVGGSTGHNRDDIPNDNADAEQQKKRSTESARTLNRAHFIRVEKRENN